MKFTLNWLKEYLDTTASLEEICEKLTSIGLEVESVTNFAETLKPFTVAEILETQPHPQADRLRVCKVNAGDNILEIVCGAPNARAGIKIPLAKIGTIIPNGNFEIKKSKIRGVESNGMLCSASELNISNDSEGILELPLSAEVGKPFAKYVGLDDALIEIAITPNRGDALGVYGVARDLAAAGLGNLKQIDNKDFEIEKGFESPIKLEIDDVAKNACNWFVGVYVKNVSNKPSPEWLKQRLESIGKKPISALVDITNYLTFAFSRPAHIYDADKISGKLTVRYAKESEKIIALDNKEYSLSDAILVASDDNYVHSIAGVMGATESGCSLDTKNIFLEMACFESDVVSKSGRLLQIDSDSRYRFERGVDKNSSHFYKMAVNLILDICGGQASAPEIAGDISYKHKNLQFDYNIIEKITGVKADETNAKSIFENLGFIIKGNNFTIPSWRNDISIPQDLAEEYARIVGYDNIPLTYLVKPAKSVVALNQSQKKSQVSRRLLASCGFNEVVSFSFMNEDFAKIFYEKDLIEIENPISSDLGVMRPYILPNLLEAISKNQSRGKKSFSFFEIGSAFSKHADGNFIQSQNICGVRSGLKSAKSPLSVAIEYDVFDIKKDLLKVLSLYFDVSKLSVSQNVEFKFYHPGRSGVYKLGNNIIAVFGEVHPSVKQKYDIKTNIYSFEVFVDKLPISKEKSDYSRKPLEISNFQAIERDFAFILDTKTLAQDVLVAVRKSEKNIQEATIEEVNIFDIYEGAKLGEGKKSIAFNVRIQPKNATLTDEHIEQVSNKIIESVRLSTGGILRDK
jgi:phenylalanyl-tRNA synthetase beta chain